MARQAILYPYYTHSRYDLFEKYAGNKYETVGMKTVLKKLKAEINDNIKRLEYLEAAFYNSIGIQGSTIDDQFRNFLTINRGQTDDALYNDILSKDDYSIIMNKINIAINNKGDKFFNDWASEITKQQSPDKDIQMVARDALRIQLNRIIDWPEQDKPKVEKVIDKLLRENEVQFNDTVEYRNLRGSFGEIRGSFTVKSIERVVGQQAVQEQLPQIQQFLNTGQITFRHDGREDQLSSDLVFTTNLPGTKKKVNIGWQIKDYDLNKSGYKNRIRLSSFTKSSFGSKENIEKVSNEGIIQKKHYKYLVYALVNYHWFNKYGTITRPSKRNEVDDGEVQRVRFNVTKKDLGRKGKSIIDDVKRVFGMLSVSNMTRNLQDTIVLNKNGTTSVGTVNLYNNDGTIRKKIEKNIPPVFWIISNTYFFPTRYVLKNLIAWLDDLEQQTYSPTYISVTMGEKQPAFQNPLEFYESKADAAEGGLGAATYTDPKLVAVGKKQGLSIAESIKVTEDIAIIRKYLKNITRLDF